MTSIIKFTPLSGARRVGAPSESPDNPHCYILEVDTFCFLLDCGSDSNFYAAGTSPSASDTPGTDPLKGEEDDPHFVALLRKWVPKIDAVLLSYPDLLHLGFLPVLVGKLGLQCPIYATVPVYKMGQMFLYDVFQAKKNVEHFEEFTLDEVDKAFDMMTQLKYNQTINLKGKGEGIAITPLPAGHMLGGTIWKIVKDGEEDIVYAVDFNHKKEQHLNGCDIEKIQRPSLLITDAYNAKFKQVRRRHRDETLMTSILQTLRNNGNVLVSVDTAGRVLELAHMVDHLWQIQDSGLLAYSVALVNNVSYNVIEFAKSQMEWMSEKLLRLFEGKRNNPFQFKHLKLCHNMNEVNKVPSPKVVLASMPDMECGYSRELFLAWCTNPRNCVIVTSRSGEGTLAHQIVKAGTDSKVTLLVKKRVRLVGEELEEYRRKERESNKMSTEMIEDESSDEEMIDVSATTYGKKKSVPKHDILVCNETSRHHTGFFKSLKNKYQMFPFHEEKIRWDDYGEIIKPEEWFDISTDMEKTKNGPNSAIGKDNHDIAMNTEDIEVPTKCISSHQTFHVKCKIQYIDFEGRSDADSIFNVVSTIKPRRTIIVRGSDESAKALSDHCRQVAIKFGETASNDEQKVQKAVFVPQNGESVDATTESFIYQVRLPESLVSQLTFSRGKDGMLAWVDGVITHSQTDVLGKPFGPLGDEEGSTEESKRPTFPTLLPLPADAEPPRRKSVFVNELKLSDFKLVLLKNDIPSEFVGGVLFCGSRSQVALRRHDSGRVTIEGTVCDEYYTVRSLLYEQYAIV